MIICTLEIQKSQNGIEIDFVLCNSIVESWIREKKSRLVLYICSNKTALPN